MSQKTLQKDAFKGGTKKFKFIDDSASSNDSSSDDSPPPKKPLTKIQTKFNKLDNTIKPPLKLHKLRFHLHSNRILWSIPKHTICSRRLVILTTKHASIQ